MNKRNLFTLCAASLALYLLSGCTDLQSQDRFYELEHSIVRKDNGEVRHLLEKCEHMRDPGGRVIRSIGIVCDITDRKKAESERSRQLDELKRWYTVTLGREQRVGELKSEVNRLAARLGLPPPYAEPGAKADSA